MKFNKGLFSFTKKEFNKNPASKDDLVNIATFFELGEAYFYKSTLEKEGVKVFLFDENISSLISGVMGFRLMVKGSDEEKSKNILKEYHSYLKDEEK